jgi:hypothetical protein
MVASPIANPIETYELSPIGMISDSDIMDRHEKKAIMDICCIRSTCLKLKAIITTPSMLINVV